MANRLEYGEGSVYRRTDGRWVGTLEAGWTDRNTRRRISVTAKSEAAVRRRLRDRRAELRHAAETSTASDAARKTVKGWADEWLAIRQSTVRPSTYTNDRSNLRLYVVPTIGTRRLVDLAPRDVRAVEARIRDAGHGAPTSLRTKRVLVKMLRDAVEEGYGVPGTIFAIKADRRRGVAKPKREALEVAQAIAVLAQAEDLPHGLRYLVGFLQGLRQGEALGLTWDAIDFEARTITVRWQLQAVPYADKHDRSKGFRLPDDYEVRHLAGRFHLVPLKTENGERVIPMIEPIRDALLSLRETTNPGPRDLLWTRVGGWPIDKHADSEEFRALQAAAGVRHPSGRPYTTHEMRNTTATILNELGVDPVTVKAILGHSSYATSQGYMTARQPRMATALRGVADALTAKALEAPSGS